MTVLDDSARWRKLEQIVTNGQEVTITRWGQVDTVHVVGDGVSIQESGNTVSAAFDRAYPLWEEEARKGKGKL